MEKDIDVYEFEWWSTFALFVLVLVISLVLIIISTDFIQLYRIYYKNALYHNRSEARFVGLLFLGVVFFIFSLTGLWKIRAVPKSIIFRQNSITVIFPMAKEKVFAYEDISRFVIYRKNRWSGGSRLMSFPFRASLYFCGSRFKVMFNPERLTNFSVLLNMFMEKGVGRVIEQK